MAHVSSLTITFILTSVLERKLAIGINKISWKQQKVINAFERLYPFFYILLSKGDKMSCKRPFLSWRKEYRTACYCFDFYQCFKVFHSLKGQVNLSTKHEKASGIVGQRPSWVFFSWHGCLKSYSPWSCFTISYHLISLGALKVSPSTYLSHVRFWTFYTILQLFMSRHLYLVLKRLTLEKIP